MYEKPPNCVFSLDKQDYLELHPNKQLRNVSTLLETPSLCGRESFVSDISAPTDKTILCRKDSFVDDVSAPTDKTRPRFHFHSTESPQVLQQLREKWAKSD